MILEGLVTTRNADGSVNVAPMGPKLDRTADGRPRFDRFLLRPFRTSVTYGNLVRDRCGVLHVTDDVLLLAKAAVLDDLDAPPVVPASVVKTDRLADCCRYFEFQIDEIDDAGERTSMVARVVHAGTVRGLSGLNRAKHAIVEAAILATRKHLIDAPTLRAEFERLRPLVEKTGGPQEHEAFFLLQQFLEISEAER